MHSQVRAYLRIILDECGEWLRVIAIVTGDAGIGTCNCFQLEELALNRFSALDVLFRHSWKDSCEFRIAEVVCPTTAKDKGGLWF